LYLQQAGGLFYRYLVDMVENVENGRLANAEWLMLSTVSMFCETFGKEIISIYGAVNKLVGRRQESILGRSNLSNSNHSSSSYPIISTMTQNPYKKLLQIITVTTKRIFCDIFDTMTCQVL
jgi:hypothetical protein